MMKTRYLLAALALCAAVDGHAALLHDYEFNGNLNDALTGPALVANGGTVGPGAYSFHANQGLQLQAYLGATYTIDMVYHFDALPNWQKIVDFSDLTKDTGLYANFNAYNLFSSSGGAGAITAGKDTRLSFTRSADASFRLYQDGVQVMSFKDSSGYADFSGHYATFFRDDRNGSEAGAGSVDFIRIYDNALSAAELLALTDPTRVSEPGSCLLLAMGLGALGAAMSRRRYR